jgi:hypothetical protein
MATLPCSFRGEVTDYVLMEGRGFGFVTYKDPANAQQFLEVCDDRSQCNLLVPFFCYCCSDGLSCGQTVVRVSADL